MIAVTMRNTIETKQSTCVSFVFTTTRFSVAIVQHGDALRGAPSTQTLDKETHRSRGYNTGD